MSCKWSDPDGFSSYPQSFQFMAGLIREQGNSNDSFQGRRFSTSHADPSANIFTPDGVEKRSTIPSPSHLNGKIHKTGWQQTKEFRAVLWTNSRRAAQ